MKAGSTPVNNIIIVVIVFCSGVPQQSDLHQRRSRAPAASPGNPLPHPLPDPPPPPLPQRPGLLCGVLWPEASSSQPVDTCLVRGLFSV